MPLLNITSVGCKKGRLFYRRDSRRLIILAAYTIDYSLIPKYKGGHFTEKNLGIDYIVIGE